MAVAQMERVLADRILGILVEAQRQHHLLPRCQLFHLLLPSHRPMAERVLEDLIPPKEPRILAKKAHSLRLELHTSLLLNLTAVVATQALEVTQVFLN